MAAEKRDPTDDSQRSWYRTLKIQVALIAVTIATGATGTYLQLTSLAAYSDEPSIEVAFESVFASLGFLVLNSGPYPIPGGTPLSAFVLVVVGRIAGVVFFSYAAFLAFKTLFAERLKLWCILFWKDRFGGSTKHFVVCGVGEKGFELASELLDRGHDVVAIEPAESSTRARELSDRGAAVLRGDATRRRTLGERAQVHRASEVFVNCGSDRTNARVVRTLADWLDERSDASTDDGYLTCHAHVGARRWRRFIRDRLGDQSNLRLQLYDTANATARELLRQRPVERFGEEPDAGRTHVALVGWSDVSRALVFQLCETMHYLDGRERAITVACRDPDAARRELYDRYPAIDPGYWDRESFQSFVADVFPEISFVELPGNMDQLLSDRFALYDRVQRGDTLTIVVADDAEFPSGGPVSTMLPRLEELDRELELDTKVHYFSDATDEPDRRSDTFEVDSEAIDVRSFREFVDECTLETVRSERRDRVAKRMALFFHLRYDYDPTTENPTDVDRELGERLPFRPPDNGGYDYDRVAEFWEELPESRLQTLAEVVWRHLPETERDANRHAADHARVKRRIAAALEADADRETNVRELAAVEHRRWCAEKLLDGWEPLPEEDVDRWKMDGDAQDVFREQKYHLALRPLSEIERVTEGEVEKDVSLVRFVLDHLHE